MSVDLRADWTPSQAEFDAFAALSGDDNPIHTDAAFSARSGFGRTVAHGMLIYARLWALLAAHEPRLRQTGQTMMFPNPAFADEPLELSARGALPGRVRLCARRVADGAEVFTGDALTEC